MNENLFENIDFQLLQKIASRYQMNYHDARDCTQQLLLIAWERRNDITKDSWHNYLSRTLEVVYNKQRKHYDKFLTKPINEIQNENKSPEYYIILQEFNVKANKIIEDLTPIQKKTLEYKLLNYTISKIAKKTNTNKGTVMSRLYTIRQKLKNELIDFIDIIK